MVFLPLLDYRTHLRSFRRSSKISKVEITPVGKGENGVFKRFDRQRVGDHRAATIIPKEENSTASVDKKRTPQWHLLQTQEWL